MEGNQAMSWASHNPELYTELCNNGIAKKLFDLKTRKAFTLDEAQDYVAQLQDGNAIEQLLYEVLNDWATDEIRELMNNHFARQSDAAFGVCELDDE